MLIADSDAASVEQLARPLELQGMQVCRCTDVERLRNRLAHTQWDMVMLNLRIAGPLGLDLLREASAVAHPAAMVVTGHGMTETDRIVALELGADHCVDQRCSPAEMLAVVRALLARRAASPDADDVAGRDKDAHFAGMRYDPLLRLLHTADGRSRRIRTAEADLLMRFLRNPRHVFRREELLGETEAEGLARNPRGADVLVSRLRAALGPEHWELIRTKRGRGYFLSCDVLWH
ncbi:hypothetical protein TS85_09545 [Sphingomonas hengshuiensis]|uniref:DNA-binding response regulator n=1 Tax=Sphingomonas hengshuiensis TaxID=1609977 RepID=A0A7U4LF15_9SPHN|nr:hypothetical protein TS85_09545 [Sphingomonas hengshuiensis]